jgi:hypothetical protein
MIEIQPTISRNALHQRWSSVGDGPVRLEIGMIARLNLDPGRPMAPLVVDSADAGSDHNNKDLAVPARRARHIAASAIQSP